MALFRLCFSASLLFLFFSSHGQFIPATRYTTKDGMFTERITAITQDSKGFMWFGTYLGVMRYDGYQWQKIDLPEPARNKIALGIAAVGDRIYAGMGFAGGLVEIHNGKARMIELPENYSEAIALTVNADSSLALVLTRIHPAYSIAVWKYESGQFSLAWKIPLGYGNIGITADTKNRLWVSTNHGAFIIDKKHFIRLIKDTAVESISLNRNGSMVVRSTADGYSIARFIDVKTLKLRSHCKVEGVGILPQFENNDSGAWGVEADRLVRLEESGKVLRYQIDIPKKTVTGPIFIDREKNIWFSTEAGLYKFSNLKAQTFYFEEKGPTSTFILPVEESKIITTGHAIYSLRGIQLRKIYTLQGPSAFLFRDHKKNIWISHWAGKNGVTVANFTGNKLSIQKNFPGSAANIAEDTKGNVWVGGAGGIAGGGFAVYKNLRVLQHIPLDLPEQKNIQIINFYLDEHEQTIWAGTSYWGLLKIKYALDEKGRYKLTVVDRIDRSKGFKDHTIRGNIFKDSKGRLWVGTRNSGISRIVENNDKYVIKNFSEKEGVTCSRINYITEHKGSIWFAACDGVYQINDAGLVRKYNTGDGLVEDYVLHIALEGDTLWAGGSEGVTKLLLTGNRTIPPPPVALSDVRVLGISDSALYYPGKTSFSSSHNSIGFTFTSNSFINEKKTLYKYKLEGFDKNWSLPGATNNINYASLPPGDYSFKVMAQNAAGIWSDKPAVFEFRIISPFYMQAWFVLLVTGFLLAVAYTIYLYRRKHRAKMEALRMDIARDLHDDIGSALGSINILSRTAQRKIEGNTETEALMNKIGSTAQKTLESMDEIIWTINPLKEKAIDLVVRMQSFAQPLLESEEIAFNLDSDVETTQPLSMQLKRNLFLIFKEIIYNSIRHSRCTKIDVRFCMANKLVLLEVKDNGRGIEFNEKMIHRNGLANIKLRVDSIKGSYTVHSGKGQGTTFIIKAPAV